MRRLKYFVFAFCFWSLSVFAQGPYAPAVGQLGTKAIHKEDVLFDSWAIECTVQRGSQDIAQPSLGPTTAGDSSSALGMADFKTVSLGDGGQAVLKFNGAIYNGPGADFAVFENAFNDSFLELAFVEVSSDGENFFRFPAHSLTDTTQPVGSFGTVDPTMINNLAGKYRGGYGTPFDLEDLKDQEGLDRQNITHIKLIDVVGSLADSVAGKDSAGRKINEMYPTPFPTGGFDLDAVGVIYLKTVGIDEYRRAEPLSFYPNPVRDQLHLSKEWFGAHYQISDMNGRIKQRGTINSVDLYLGNLKSGIYLITVHGEKGVARSKLVKQ